MEEITKKSDINTCKYSFRILKIAYAMDKNHQLFFKST